MGVDVYPEPISRSSNSLGQVVEIYGQELFAGDTTQGILDQIDGNETFLYYDDDGNAVGASSIDLSRVHLGLATLEYMAVDRKFRKQGYGAMIIEEVLKYLTENSDLDSPRLDVRYQEGTKDYYIDRGAVQDDDGNIYFGEPYPSTPENETSPEDEDEDDSWREFLDDEDNDLGRLRR